ncbi:hypothetical protein PYW07_012673 [Mythimna separata]|uniref:Kazal-like domain-containing protein n=1 Tax=Mythimna separata TaxID=271217 RepID=A0AAD8DL20_MYTSE|nr:hypothetical protein PYW07_012673 [Mythimna separata]
MKWLFLILQIFVIVYAKKEKDAPPQKVPLPNSPSIDNPNFIRDRLKYEILKPEMPPTWTNRHQQLYQSSCMDYCDPYHYEILKPEMPPTWTNRHQQLYQSSWMDYCDPYHCNDYHRTVCGLNRRNMRFKWFQSACHLILNNQCSYFRGLLKYDMVETKYCHAYVMYLREGCPQQTDCDDYKINPLCAVSSIDGHAVLFKNKCFLDAVNCKNNTLQEYDVVRMSICEHLLKIDTSKEKLKSEESFVYIKNSDGEN